MSIKHLFLLLLILTVPYLRSQTVPPKRETRAVWVATVTNIDWPSSKTLTTAVQKTEFTTLLDRHKLSKMNAIFAQVRPSCDAFYNSTIEPWSEWLMGNQGQAPSPFYDPLQFMVDETHKRGMEFHAWLNPYRAVVSSSASVSASHISIRKPQWVRQFGTLKMLDPGLPEVRDYILSVIMDIVRRYDIDGVHFDDYFYPYPQTGVVFPDSVTFATYPRGFTNKNDWRRDNVNILIKAIRDSVKSVKPWVKFGIGPFGIWRNRSTDPLGSATSGLQSYDEIYCDSRKWLLEGWIDYVAPQVYWNFGFSAAKYEVLVPWWSSLTTNRHIIVGQAAYRINPTGTDTAWKNLSQMPNQIRFNRTFPGVEGSVYFSSKSLTNNLGGFQDTLRRDLNKYFSIPHTMPWLDSIKPLPVSNLRLTGDSSLITLTWQNPGAASDGNLPNGYIVYRFQAGSPVNLEDPRNILTILTKDSLSYKDNISTQPDKRFVYAVTSLDRMYNESSAELALFGTTGVETGEPLAMDFALSQNFPNPFNPATQFTVTAKVTGPATVAVYNTLGEQVHQLFNGILQKGTTTFTFDASQLPGGIYIYRVQCSGFTASKKMLLLK